MTPREQGRFGGRAGFTMIELVLVVSLIAIFTAIVAPTFQVSSIRRVENVAHQVVAHLELARSDALASRRLTKVLFDVANGRYGAFVDHDDDGTIAGVAAEMGAFAQVGIRDLDDLVVFGRGSASAFPGDATSDAVTLPGNALDLDNQGIPSPWGTMGVIYLTHSRDPAAVVAVSVASSGAFKAWRWYPDDSEWR